MHFVWICQLNHTHAWSLHRHFPGCFTSRKVFHYRPQSYNKSVYQNRTFVMALCYQPGNRAVSASYQPGSCDLAWSFLRSHRKTMQKWYFYMSDALLFVESKTAINIVELQVSFSWQYLVGMLRHTVSIHGPAKSRRWRWRGYGSGGGLMRCSKTSLVANGRRSTFGKTHARSGSVRHNCWLCCNCTGFTS